MYTTVNTTDRLMASEKCVEKWQKIFSTEFVTIQCQQDLGCHTHIGKNLKDRKKGQK